MPNQSSLSHNRFRSPQSLKLIRCLIFSQVYRLKYSSHQFNQLQLQVSDLCNQINSKFSNNSPKTHNLAESVFCHKLNKYNNHHLTIFQLLESLSNSSLAKTISVIQSEVKRQRTNNLNHKSQHQLISLVD